MHSLPEVHEAAARLAAGSALDVPVALEALAELAAHLVPSCVGVSLSLAGGGGTVTAADAGADVRTTRSIPLRAPDHSLLAVLHLYSDDPAGFDDPVVPHALRAGQPRSGVVDADLGFATLEQARQLPLRLDEQARVDQATGVLMHERACSLQEASAHLRQEADRAGLLVVAAADLVLARSA